MNEIQAAEFHEPKPQPALGGALGLTSREIANVLGARHDKVKESIERIREVDQNFTPKGEIDCREGRGRRETRFVLTVEDAKLVVAQYRSKVGIAFARYLIEFEKRAREREPELRAAFAALEEEVATLRARLEATARPKALPRPATLPVTTHVARYDSLHGDGQVFVRHLVLAPTGSSSSKSFELTQPTAA